MLVQVGYEEFVGAVMAGISQCIIVAVWDWTSLYDDPKVASKELRHTNTVVE